MEVVLKAPRIECLSHRSGWAFSCWGILIQHGSTEIWSCPQTAGSLLHRGEGGFTFKLQLCMCMQHPKACYIKLTKMFHCLIIKFWLLGLQWILRHWLLTKTNPTKKQQKQKHQLPLPKKIPNPNKPTKKPKNPTNQNQTGCLIWFHTRIQLIYNCLYLAHLPSKLSSAPRLSPLGISFPSLLDPSERTYICRSPYSLSYLKNKNSLQRHSWARHQMLSLRDYNIFTDFRLKLRADYSLFAWCCFLHFPLMLWQLTPGWSEILGGSQICASTATCVPKVPCSVKAFTIARQITWAHQ